MKQPHTVVHYNYFDTTMLVQLAQCLFQYASNLLPVSCIITQGSSIIIVASSAATVHAGIIPLVLITHIFLALKESPGKFHPVPSN